MKLKATQAFELGWAILPVKQDKRPFFKWQEYQKTKPDKDMITGWNEKYNPPAWGVITGAISGIIVLDFDGELGRIALEKTGLKPHVQTGSGGFHVYVEHPGFRIKTLNSKSKRDLRARYPGVDIRADGGYAICCGKSSIGSYIWLQDPVPYPISTIPDDLRDCLGLNPPDCDNKMVNHDDADCSTNPDELVITAVNKSSSGRNDAGFQLACQLRDKGFTETEAELIMLRYQARVQSVNAKGQEELYTVEEAMASLKQAYSSRPHEPQNSVKIETGVDRSDMDEIPINARPWPKPLSSVALRGLAGEFVNLVGPHTESDPVALLISYFVLFGNVIGRSAYFVAEADRHFMNLFIALVGLTSKSRKGSSLGQVMRMFREIDPQWDAERVLSGLSSGEGLIWAVRDAVQKEEPIKEKKVVVGYQTIITDIGVQDKRLLVSESEFANTLRVMGRSGSTLSAVIRNAWDSGNLRILSKNAPASSTGAHISIVAHITITELLRELNNTEASNGFGNRFLFNCVRRSKTLPEGSQLSDALFQSHIQKLKKAVTFARSTGQMTRDKSARKLWHQVYPELSEGKPGLLGAMIARAEAQVMRLACIYALLDCCSVVSKEHLQAALELWRYAEDSARFIFGDSLGDPVADDLIMVLRATNEGLTRTQISNHFDRNRDADQIARALGVLLEHGLVRTEHDSSGEGRPVEKWHAVLSTNEIYEFSPEDEGVLSYNSLNSYPDTRDENIPYDSEPKELDLFAPVPALPPAENDQDSSPDQCPISPQEMDEIIWDLAGREDMGDACETNDVDSDSGVYVEVTRHPMGMHISQNTAALASYYR